MATHKTWIKQHINDPFVKKAQSEGFVSRAAYKLIQLQEKYHFIKNGMTVLELGAAPGGWTQVIKKYVGNNGKIIALDLLPMQIHADITFIQGDFTEAETFDKLLGALNHQKIDLVLSDMAPNLSGQKSIDQPRVIYLLELAWDCAQKVLKPGGTFLFKLFHGSGSEAFVKTLRASFKSVKWQKPEASRSKSSEVYVLAEKFLME